MDAADEGERAREPAPLPVTLCTACETRPAYQHDCCKACHDNRWYRGKCADCTIEGRYPPGARTTRRESPPTVEDSVSRPYRPRDRRNPGRTPRHPYNCHCHYCDPSQPLVRVGGYRRDR